MKKIALPLVIIVLALIAVGFLAFKDEQLQTAPVPASEETGAPDVAVRQGRDEASQQTEEDERENKPAVTGSNPQRPTEPLYIVTADGAEQHAFQVELAEDPREQQQGLMYRTELAEDHGMLFIFPQERERHFWMKNTYVPLDIVFVKANGEIESIAENAEPLSLKVLSSQGPVLHVLELPGGTAERLNISAGDVIHHESFGNKLAE